MSIKKLLICPYFGAFPEWMDLFIADFMRTMKPQGYDLLIDTDLPAFKERVKLKLGIECPIVRGSGKVWDYRGSFGVLYSEEIKDYDFYGHCDFDVVWGNMNKFIPDSLLEELDVYSSHHEYVCGCFSLYRNRKEVNELFKRDILPDEMSTRWHPLWQIKMSDPQPTGWIEHEYSRTLERSGLRYIYSIAPQGNPFTDRPKLKKEGDSLFQVRNYEDFHKEENFEWTEIGFFHFRRSKKWPL